MNTVAGRGQQLLLASRAVPTAMGQQVYERELIRRVPLVVPESWSFRQCIVRTLRSPLPGNARLPSALLADAPSVFRRAAGHVLYRGADLVHRLDLRLPPASSMEVLTIHDDVCWRFDDEGSTPKDAMASARRARAVICPSQFSADEVAERLGLTAAIAVPNGVDEAFLDAAPLAEEVLADLGIRGRFVLHTGGCTKRKNLAGLAEAWTHVQPAHRDVTLVLVGPPDRRRDDLFGALDAVVRLGRVAGEILTGLVASASAVVVPSIYEGFGLPALEAMAARTPVVAADRASLPEVCGDGAVLVEPSGDGIAAGLDAVLHDDGDLAAMVERGRERANRFSWQASAEGHARVWMDVIAGRVPKHS